MSAENASISEIALEWHRAGKRVILATVVETWGSAPRPTGSQLVVSAEAEMMGSVSGGCVEGAVIAEALEAAEDGQCRLLEFGVSDDDAFSVGLACGGRIRIMVEPVGIGQGPEILLLEQIAAAEAGREAIGIETDTGNWSRRLIHYEDAPAAFDADRSGFAEDGVHFRWVANPPLRLAIIGGVHIAQPLVRMAALDGYDVTVIDPREAFASPARFPGERLAHEWPDAALEAHGLDHRTALVTLTHDPKLDDPALIAAIPSPVFYIGALGSKRTHGKRIERLKAAGFREDQIARIHAPIGLDIGARSPAEIAIAILAEMTARLRRPETRPGGLPAQPARMPEPVT